MSECDICKERRVVREAIFQTIEGTMLVLSLCGEDDCLSSHAFLRVSNFFSLDNSTVDEVE
jgi:hypothetical protein